MYDKFVWNIQQFCETFIKFSRGLYSIYIGLYIYGFFFVYKPMIHTSFLQVYVVLAEKKNYAKSSYILYKVDI